MLNGKKIVVVMPSYNAAKTLAKTVAEIPRDIVDEILLVDDASSDRTVELANDLGLTVFLHAEFRLWPQSEDVLRRGTEARCGHRDNGAPRLSVFAAANSADGRYDRLRRI